MAKIKGLCHNDDCDLAAEGVIQEVEKSNFVCEECGKPLIPFGNTSTKPKNGWQKNVAIGVAALAVLGGGGFALSQMGGGEEKTPEAVNKVDTAKVEPVKADTAKVEPVSEPVKPEAEKKRRQSLHRRKHSLLPLKARLYRGANIPVLLTDLVALYV